MKIFTYGIDHLTVNSIKNHGYQVVILNRFPEYEQVKNQVFIVSSDHVPVNELNSIREKYPETTLIYHYLKKNIRGYAHIHMLCQQLGIHFISSMATAKTFLDKLRLIFEVDEIQENRIVGFFSSGPGIGCTCIAATFAKGLASRGKKVILLGLNLYDPGWNMKASVSLDQWRPKITAKIIQNEDFNQLIKIDGFCYLPGNYDYLSAMDYSVNEIEYLIEKALENADIVVCDFGAIPQSAAWYVGMQYSSIRYFITITNHLNRMKELLNLTSHLDLENVDFSLIVNQSNNHDVLTPKSMQIELGIPHLIEIPKGVVNEISIDFGKRDQNYIDQQIDHLLVALGFSHEIEKKRGLFV